ncbi:hypothetical protein NO1_0119 [Candidatus Termititenax aidoneus]|uniref:Uncharacterized protein n=1 Tax=Termititenax aidoneus TaxID=2218524 RepID=A0A388T7U1_TERA1|nr:hypothetical protein NO1_0119 [Candidatus Termititenax aidoneus]
MSDINISAAGGLAKYDTTGPEQKPDGKITNADLNYILSDPEKKEKLLEDIAEEAINADNKGQKAKADELKIAYFDISNDLVKTLQVIELKWLREDLLDKTLKKWNIEPNLTR